MKTIWGKKSLHQSKKSFKMMNRRRIITYVNRRIESYLESLTKRTIKYHKKDVKKSIISFLHELEVRKIIYHYTFYYKIYPKYFKVIFNYNLWKERKPIKVKVWMKYYLDRRRNR